LVFISVFDPSIFRADNAQVFSSGHTLALITIIATIFSGGI
jgi:hypothetical protein